MAGVVVDLRKGLLAGAERGGQLDFLGWGYGQIRIARAPGRAAGPSGAILALVSLLSHGDDRAVGADLHHARAST